MFPVWRGIFCLEISSIFGLNVSPRALYSWSWEPPPSPLQIYSQNSPLLPLARMSPHPPTHLSFGHHVQGEFPLRGGREVPICFHHPLPLLPPIVFWGPLIESTQPLLPFYMSWLEEKYQTTDNMEITPDHNSWWLSNYQSLKGAAILSWTSLAPVRRVLFHFLCIGSSRYYLPSSSQTPLLTCIRMRKWLLSVCVSTLLSILYMYFLTALVRFGACVERLSIPAGSPCLCFRRRRSLARSWLHWEFTVFLMHNAVTWISVQKWRFYVFDTY